MEFFGRPWNAMIGAHGTKPCIVRVSCRGRMAWLIQSAQPDLFAPPLTPPSSNGRFSPRCLARGRHQCVGAPSRVSASFCHRHRDRRHRCPSLEPRGLRPGDDHDHGGFRDDGRGRDGHRLVWLRRRAATTMAWKRAGIVQPLLRPAYGRLPCQSVWAAQHAALRPGALHADAVALSKAAGVESGWLSPLPDPAGHAPLPSVRRGHRWSVLRRLLSAGQEAAHDQHRRRDEQRPRHIDDRAAPQHRAE